MVTISDFRREAELHKSSVMVEQTPVNKKKIRKKKVMMDESGREIHKVRENPFTLRWVRHLVTTVSGL